MLLFSVPVFPWRLYFDRYGDPHFSLLNFSEVFKLILFCWFFSLLQKLKNPRWQIHDRGARVANLTTLPTRYSRANEGGRTFSVRTSKCGNHLTLKLLAFQSVNFLRNYDMKILNKVSFLR